MRPSLIEHYLITLHTGGWFEWTDIHNKVYSNLKLSDKIWDSSYQGTIHEEGMIVNPYSLPTEQECTDGLAALQTAFDDAQTKAASDKTSGTNKLKALGLTDDEIAAITRG